MTNLEAFLKVLGKTNPSDLGIPDEDLVKFNEQTAKLKTPEDIARLMVLAALFLASDPKNQLICIAKAAVSMTALYQDVEKEEKVH